MAGSVLTMAGLKWSTGVLCTVLCRGLIMVLQILNKALFAVVNTIQRQF